MRSNHCRPAGRLCYLAAILLTGALTLRAADIPPATTLIQDTIYRANGTPARGTVVISWPAFETLDRKTVAAGVVTVTIGDGGLLSVPLVPNQGATPVGTYYRVVTKLDDGTTTNEYWNVPNISPVTVASIRATIQPVPPQAPTGNFVQAAEVSNEPLANKIPRADNAGVLHAGWLGSAVDALVPKTTTVNGHPLSGNVSVTKGDIGLGNVDNTADAAKPVSTAQLAALDLKAPLASPTFTGTVTIGSQTPDDPTNGLSVATSGTGFDYPGPYLWFEPWSFTPTWTPNRNTTNADGAGGGNVTFTYDSPFHATASSSTPNAAAIEVTLVKKNSGNVDNLYGLDINTPVGTGSGTWKNNAGIHVRSQSGASTNSYGLLIDDPQAAPGSHYSMYVAGGKTHLGGDVTAGTLNSVVNAATQSGATVGEQIDNACSSLAGQSGMVLVPSTMGSGNSSSGIPDNCRVMDLRGVVGPDFYGQESQNWNKDILFRGRWTAAPAGARNIQTMHVHAEPAAGGSQGPAKTNWAAISATMDSRTVGQHQNFSSWAYNFSSGDTIAFWGTAKGYGNALAGDEGIEGASVLASQGTEVFTGTVASIAAGTLTYSAATEAKTLGEQRPVIITTPAKVYSTGSVVSIAGTPPVVTGTGTSWTTLGTGAVSNLFFAMNADTNGSLKLVVPVRSITDNTHLVLNYTGIGMDAGWTATTSGAYKIFRGGIATAVAPAQDQITVAPSGDFAADDTIEQPLGCCSKIVGLNVNVAPLLPSPGNTRPIGIHLGNGGSKSVYTGLALSGSYVRGIDFAGTWDRTSGMSDGVAPAIHMDNSPGRVIWNSDAAHATSIYVQDSAGAVGDVLGHDPTTNLFYIGDTSSERRITFSAVSGNASFGGNVSTTGYMDVSEIAAPANPAAGVERWYASSASHTWKCLNSSGGDCAPSAGRYALTFGSSTGSSMAACSNGGGTTSYIGLGGATNTTEASVIRFLVPVSGTLKNFNIKLSANVPASESAAFKISKNGSTTGTPAVTVGAGTSTGSQDTSTATAVVAGDLISVAVTCSGGTTALTGPVVATVMVQ